MAEYNNNELCHRCGHGRNCINGRWCEVRRTYVEYVCMTECPDAVLPSSTPPKKK